MDQMGLLEDKLGKTITDDQDMGNILNRFFTSIFTIEDCRQIAARVNETQ